MMKGTPYVYQGEELGMTNAGFTELDQYQDLESINAYRTYVAEGDLSHEEMMTYLGCISRDNARTPMQWDSSDQAGFTTGTPWLAVNQNYKDINAAAQTEDEASVYSYYKRLIQLRHELDIIVYGSFRLLMEEDENIFAYVREYEGRSLFVYCNFTDREQPCQQLTQGVTRLIGNYADCCTDFLRPYEAVVYLSE
jgi:oligo-1,6-glucosidase